MVRELHQCLNRSINRAMPRDLVARNAVVLSGVPRGRLGRPSKSLEFDQAKACSKQPRARSSTTPRSPCRC